MVTWWGVPIVRHIIFVPYNLFRLFLVHKISIYEYIYENRKKKWKREKEKEFPANWAGGDFGPASAGARARARAGGPAGPRRSGAARADAVGAGPCVSERRGVTAWSGRRRGGGANRSSSTVGEVHGGSPPGARFCDGGEVARHGRG
jgi:hypothetical protein